MTEKDKYRDYIVSQLDERTLLEGLGEECAELTKAAMKYIRATGENNNHTSEKPEDVMANIKEEILDVLIILDCLNLGVTQNDIDNYSKWKRWAKRLENNNIPNYNFDEAYKIFIEECAKCNITVEEGNGTFLMDGKPFDLMKAIKNAFNK